MDAENKLVKLETQCKQCNQHYHTSVKLSAYLKRLETNEYVQDIFPELSPAERELFFQTGICGTCFTEMFGDGF